MRTRILITFLVTLIFAANISSARSQKSHEIKLLIVDGFSNHDWQRTTQTIIKLLGENKGYTIEVSTSPNSSATKEQIESWNPDFSKYDVVLLNCNDLGSPVNWSLVTRNKLENFVSGGGGLFIFHSANNSFANWEEYNRMIGLGWRKKDFGKAAVIDKDEKVRIIEPGSGDGTSHGDRVDALVHRIGNHPLQKGLPKSWIFADIEVYTYARGPMENVTILTYTEDNKYHLNFPIEWVVKYGKGKVYNSTLGHFFKDQQNPEGLRCAAFQTEMFRALQWLAGRKIDARLPSDFPGTEKVSLRDNI